MKCEGLHCSGCKSGGGGTVIAVIVILLALAIGAARRPIAEAADDLGRVLLIMAEVVAGIVATSVAGLSVYLCARVTRHTRARVGEGRSGAVRPAQSLSGPRQSALPAPVRRAIAPVVKINTNGPRSGTLDTHKRS